MLYEECRAAAERLEQRSELVLRAAMKLADHAAMLTAAAVMIRRGDSDELAALVKAVVGDIEAAYPVSNGSEYDR